MKKYSQLRAMFAISRASFRSITRSPSAVVFSLAFPLIFIVVFGFIGTDNGGLSINVVVKSGSDTLNPVYNALSKNSLIRFNRKEKESDMTIDLSKGRIDAILDIQKNNFPNDSVHSPYIINLQTTKASEEKGRILEMTIRDIVSHVNAAMYKNIPTLAQINLNVVSLRAYKNIDFILPGQLGFSILSAGVFGTAFVFYSLRSTLVLKRFFATPIRREYIVLGECLSRLVFQLIGCVIIILIGWSVFGFTLIHGVTTVLLMLVLAIIGLIVFMGMGFFVSGISKNESSIPPLANIFTLPQFLLTGTFFPIDVFPSWLQPFCRLLPLTYLNDAMRKVAFEGAGLFDIAVSKDILGLIVWSIIVYFFAVKTFKWE